jgi:hypothetical protein
VIFRGKFRGISSKNDFSKLLFPQKSPTFPNILGRKFSEEFSQKFSPEKMYEKLAPDEFVKNHPNFSPTRVFENNAYSTLTQEKSST